MENKEGHGVELSSKYNKYYRLFFILYTILYIQTEYI